ncbi:MAG: hypothetical protein HYZ72_12320 [Deltaproteobacteria bacterium]|nr:hypothetical protein [Deltaproteobacteria bacterium]
MMKPLLLLLFLLGACPEQTPQTGHRVIAAAVRGLLDKSYAGIDYPTYRDSLREVDAVCAEQRKATPTHLRDRVEQMLAYLRTAEEILRWQAEQGNGQEQPPDNPRVAAWIDRYPFLRAAVGAHTANVFDPDTALVLLWDKTDEVLRGFQVKSNPL